MMEVVKVKLSKNTPAYISILNSYGKTKLTKHYTEMYLDQLLSLVAKDPLFMLTRNSEGYVLSTKIPKLVIKETEKYRRYFTKATQSYYQNRMKEGDVLEFENLKNLMDVVRIFNEGVLVSEHTVISGFIVSCQVEDCVICRGTGRSLPGQKKMDIYDTMSVGDINYQKTVIKAGTIPEPDVLAKIMPLYAVIKVESGHIMPLTGALRDNNEFAKSFINLYDGIYNEYLKTGLIKINKSWLRKYEQYFKPMI